MYWGNAVNNVDYSVIDKPILRMLPSDNPTSRCRGPNQKTMAMERKKEDTKKVEGGGKMAEVLVDACGEKEGGSNVSTGASLMAGTIPSAPTGRKN